jgi:hypothetical protein
MVDLKTPFLKMLKISEERLDICRVCEYFDEERNKCKNCGCFMDFKTMIPFEKCPIGKWGKVEKEKEE